MSVDAAIETGEGTGGYDAVADAALDEEARTSLRFLVRRAARELRAAGAAALLIRSDGPRILESWGVLRSVRGIGTIGALSARALRSAGPVAVNDAVEAGMPIPLPAGSNDAGRLLAVPIGRIHGTGAVLVVAAGTRRGPFTEEDGLRAEEIVARARPTLENAVLRLELRDRDQEIRFLEDELRRWVGARRRFLGSFSHELRTPLNAVLCYNDLLAEGVLGPLGPVQRHAVGRMKCSIEHLCRLIDDIFELSALETGSIAVAPSPTDLGEVAEAVIHELREPAGARGVGLAMDGAADAGNPVAIETDGTLVRRILLRLCANALNLTKRGGVVLRVRPRHDGAQVDVIDSGAGAVQPDDERTFEEFASLVSSHEGLGLDLTVAHRLAVLVGARITVQGRPGAGSIFSLVLPARIPVHA